MPSEPSVKNQIVLVIGLQKKRCEPVKSNTHSA